MQVVKIDTLVALLNLS